jgi:two-component system LytT family response regulator
MTLKVLIVDNARERASLVDLCEQRTDVRVVGEAESGVAALRAANELCPDLMLVDIKLPDMSAFDLLSAAHGQRGPLSVIVTGGLDYAADAFAAGALDYLPKPVDPARLGYLLEREQLRCQVPRTAVTLPHLEATDAFRVQPKQPDGLQFLVGERQHRLYPLELEKIDYIEAHGNYVTIRSGNCDYIRRDSIKRLAASLAERGFVRIERSVLLNVRAVAYAQVAGHGCFAFTLSSGVCVQSSSSYREAILGVLPLEPLSRRNERSNPPRSGKKPYGDAAGKVGAANNAAPER